MGTEFPGEQGTKLHSESTWMLIIANIALAKLSFIAELREQEGTHSYRVRGLDTERGKTAAIFAINLHRQSKHYA